MVTFLHRAEAARRLAGALKAKGIERPVVLGIPRGGVPVAALVARELGGDLGVIVARKLRAPGQPELAIGAVSANGVSYINQPLAEEAGAGKDYVVRELAFQAEEARRREEAFDGRRRPPLAGRTVIVVDDGIATGATAIAALRSVRASGAARVILAVPVGPPDTIEAMRAEADDVVCVAIEPDFYAIGQFYLDFSPVEDDEVRLVLDEFDRAPAGGQRIAATITRGGVTLAAVLALPKGPPPYPCLVFVHGLGSGKESPRNTVVAERLRDEGFASLLFDLSGHGESSEDPRGEAAWVDDLAAAYAWATSQPGIDPGRMIVAGSSLGGAIAARAIREGRLAPNPAALVLRAPPIERGDLGGVTMPVLAAIGSLDPLLPEVRAAVAANPPARIEVVAGASHLFEEPGALDRLLEVMIGFCAPFARATRPAGA